jgi:hypothetical protein
MIKSPPTILHPNAIVSELTDVDTRWWDSTLLENIFCKEEVQIIESLPISVSNREDRSIWRGTKNGIFSVRSAYYLQQEIDGQGEASSSSQAGFSEVWSSIWKLKIPNVEKNFLWRACNEILLTRSNLFKRKIVEDPLCPICGREPETALHTLRLCSSAMDAWCVSSRRMQKKCSMAFEIFFQLVADIFAHDDQEEIKLFGGISQRLWLRRNEVVHGGSMTHPNSIVQRTLAAIQDFSQANDVGEGASIMPVTTSPMFWRI